MVNFRIVTPANFIPINEKNEILLIKRADDDSHGGLWSIPGGAIEKGETIEEGLEREVKEEINSKIINRNYFKSFYYEYKENLHVRAAYFYGNITGEIKINEESSDYKWFSFQEILSNSFEFAFNQKKVLKDFIEFINN
jgi:mutator protein MutT